MEEVLKVLSESTWLVPWLSGAIALVSLGFSFGSRRTAKAALKLAKDQDARKLQELTVELLSAVRELNAIHIRYVYELLISNTADRANSVSRAELRLVYHIDNRPVTAVFAVERGGITSTSPSALTTFGANEAKGGSLEVWVPRSAVSNHPIDHAVLVLTDTFGSTYEIRSEHIQERQVGGTQDGKVREATG